MKLYLSDINLSKININNFKKYLISQDDIKELYSNEGIYISKNNNGFKKLKIIDGTINYITEYIDNLLLILDESYVYKSSEYISRLPIDFEIVELIKYEYKLSEKSPVTMVIESKLNNITNVYFMLIDKHGKYSVPDILNKFIKETIKEFYQLFY